jgi:membrane-bound lytic murein transglycosylase D
MMLVRRLLVPGITCLLVGCGAHPRQVAAPAPPPLPTPVNQFTGVNAPPIRLTVDATAVAIARAESAFAAGEAELGRGHLAAAREQFDAAVDALLVVPGGARSDPRLQAEFDTLLDRIGAHESLELRAANGFAETNSEPAAIDALLAVGTTARSVAPAPTTAELVMADLARTPHDIPVPVNDKVLSYIELFQGTLRSFIEEGLERGARYLPMIQDVFHAEGLPLDLAYVPLIESAFKPTALSKASAKGIWQFEAATAKDAGLEQNWFLDERADPEKATRAAAQYLKSLQTMFDGDWNLALAAYNAGMGRVQRAMMQAHETDFWALTASSRYLPRETREYVPMILAAVLIARNPIQYGFEIGPVEPLDYDTVHVPNAILLETIAEWADVPVEDIRTLNPELRRGMTPKGEHDLKVPVGTGPLVERKLASAAPSVFAAASFRFHTVKRGETLAGVARRYKTTTAKLAAANDLKTSARLRPGATLMVPAAPATALASRTNTSRPVAVARAGTAGSAVYRVKPGDTLSRIARQFDMSVDSLKQLNRLSSDSIDVGDRLTVR